MNLPVLDPEAWRQITPRAVPLDKVRFTQQGVYVRALLDVHHGRHQTISGDPIVHLVHRDGTYWIADGNTRCVYAMVTGKKFIYARVHDT